MIRFLEFRLIPILAVLGLIAASCSKKTETPTPTNSAPSVALTTPTGIQVGNVTISYTLTDAESNPCTITVEFSINSGSTWATATAGTGGDGVTALSSSSTGTAHTFVWNSVTNGVAATTPNTTVRFRITPSDAAAGTVGSTTDFTVNNAGNQLPSVSITTPVTTQSGNVGLTYTLTDFEGTACTITVQYSINGGTSWSTATGGTGGDGTTGLTSSSAGTNHTYVWNSYANGVATASVNSTVQFRITPNDGSAGTAGTTANFTVDNISVSPPSLSLTSPTGWYTGNITVSYTLTDTASNSCTLFVEYSTDNGTNWATATAGTGGDGTTGLTSSPGGTAHTYVWNTVANTVGVSAWNQQVMIRLTPSDTATGATQTSTAFTVNNTGNNPVTAGITPLTGNQTGLVILNYTLTDQDSNTISIACQYSSDAGSSWNTATAGPGGHGTTGLTSSISGTPHVFVWNSYANNVGTLSSNPAVQFKITPTDTVLGFAGTTANFTVNNTSAGSGVAIGGINFPVTWDPDTNEQVLNDMVAVGPYLYCVGRDDSGGSGDRVWSIQRRLLEDGALDTSWGTFGIITSNPTSAANMNDDEPTCIVADSTHMYIGGYQDATLLTTLTGMVSVTASVTSVTGSGTLFTSELAVDDHIIVGGEHLYIQNIASDTAMTLYSGPSGTYTNVTYQKATERRAYRVEKRLLSDGSLVTTFGTGGAYVSANPHGEGAGPWIAIDGTSVYIAGVASVVPQVDYQGIIEKISMSTGALDTGFGTGGTVLHNQNAVYADGFLGLVVTGGNIYLSAGHSISFGTPADAVATIQKRSATTGVLDSTWATLGVYSDNATSGTDIGTSIVTDGTDLFWMTKTETTNPGVFYWRFLKVNIASGTGTGVTSTSTSEASGGGPPVSCKIVLTGTHLYAFGTSGAIDPNMRVEKRLLTNLSLDNSFGTVGSFTSNPSDGTGPSGTQDGLMTGAISTGIVYIGGYSTPSGDSAWHIDAIYP